MSESRFEYLYGLNPAFEALRAGRRNFKEAFIAKNSRSQPRMKKLIALLEKNRVVISFEERDRLFQLSKSKENQGIVLKCTHYHYVSFDEIKKANKILLLDNVEDPHNVGAIIRSAEIFGFHHILLPIKGVPGIYPSVVKVSAGATEHLKIAKDANAISYIKRLVDDEGFSVVSLDGGGKDSLESIAAENPAKLVVVSGGEDSGVGQFILNNSKWIASIPQQGQINSLNASVATGIALFALRNIGN